MTWKLQKFIIQSISQLSKQPFVVNYFIYIYFNFQAFQLFSENRFERLKNLINKCLTLVNARNQVLVSAMYIILGTSYSFLFCFYLQHKDTLLIKCSQSGNDDLAEFLINLGADINAQNNVFYNWNTGQTWNSSLNKGSSLHN